MTTSSQCVQEIVIIHTVIVVKSVTKTTIIMVIRIQLRIFETDSISDSLGNESLDDNRISEVQSRCQV